VVRWLCFVNAAVTVTSMVIWRVKFVLVYNLNIQEDYSLKVIPSGNERYCSSVWQMSKASTSMYVSSYSLKYS
jgi:hypothetical protein